MSRRPPSAEMGKISLPAWHGRQGAQASIAPLVLNLADGRDGFLFFLEERLITRTSP